MTIEEFDKLKFQFGTSSSPGKNELEILPYDEAGNIYLGSLNYENSLELRIYP